MSQPLEDHAGDVIAKARAGRHLDASELARIAGLSPDDYRRFETDGPDAANAPRPNLAAVAQHLGLDAERLAALAAGWTPAPVALSRWRRLECITTAGRGMTVNAFVAWDESTREAAIFDTGFDPGPILEIIQQNRLQPRLLAITHAHGDHVAGLDRLRHAWPHTPVVSRSRTAPATDRVSPDWTSTLGDLHISIRDTPGHAEDGATFVIEGWPDNAPPVAVVGDALFAGSMGGARDAFDEARRHVLEQILSLPEPTLVCPGHGPLTTVGEQRRHNPFFPETVDPA